MRGVCNSHEFGTNIEMRNSFLGLLGHLFYAKRRREEKLQIFGEPHEVIKASLSEFQGTQRLLIIFHKPQTTHRITPTDL